LKGKIMMDIEANVNALKAKVAELDAAQLCGDCGSPEHKTASPVAIAALEARVAELGQDIEALQRSASATSAARFVTYADLETRLAKTHSTASPVAIAAQLCGDCGSPEHKTGGCRAAA
jgi:hypothetical protein